MSVQSNNYVVRRRNAVTKDYIDYRDSLTDQYVDVECCSGQEWCDEFYGLLKYRQYVEDWC